MIMRRILFLILVSVALTLAPVVERRAFGISAPLARPDGEYRPHAKAPKQRRTVSATAKRHRKSMSVEGATAKPVVREVDAEGLKKLLAREATPPARPLLINFWASWCGPCREEFPDLVRIDADYRTRGLDFILISVDDVSEINSAVPQFLQEMRATMPTYLLNTPEPEAAISAVDPTWAGELPATFLFDARGQLIFKHMGRVDPTELRQALDKVTSDK